MTSHHLAKVLENIKKYFCFYSDLQVLVDHLVDDDWRGGVEAVVVVQLRVVLLLPVLHLLAQSVLHPVHVVLVHILK